MIRVLVSKPALPYDWYYEERLDKSRRTRAGYSNPISTSALALGHFVLIAGEDFVPAAQKVLNSGDVSEVSWLLEILEVAVLSAPELKLQFTADSSVGMLLLDWLTARSTGGGSKDGPKYEQPFRSAEWFIARTVPRRVRILKAEQLLSDTDTVMIRKGVDLATRFLDLGDTTNSPLSSPGLLRGIDNASSRLGPPSSDYFVGEFLEAAKRDFDPYGASAAELSSVFARRLGDARNQRDSMSWVTILAVVNRKQAAYPPSLVQAFANLGNTQIYGLMTDATRFWRGAAQDSARGLDAGLKLLQARPEAVGQLCDLPELEAFRANVLRISQELGSNELRTEIGNCLARRTIELNPQDATTTNLEQREVPEAFAECRVSDNTVYFDFQVEVPALRLNQTPPARTSSATQAGSALGRGSPEPRDVKDKRALVQFVIAVTGEPELTTFRALTDMSETAIARARDEAARLHFRPALIRGCPVRQLVQLVLP